MNVENSSLYVEKVFNVSKYVLVFRVRFSFPNKGVLKVINNVNKTTFLR